MMARLWLRVCVWGTEIASRAEMVLRLERLTWVGSKMLMLVLMRARVIVSMSVLVNASV